MDYSRPSGSNFSTIAILAAMDDVPLTAFTLELNHALTGIGNIYFSFPHCLSVYDFVFN